MDMLAPKKPLYAKIGVKPQQLIKSSWREFQEEDEEANQMILFFFDVNDRPEKRDNKIMKSPFFSGIQVNL